MCGIVKIRHTTGLRRTGDRIAEQAIFSCFPQKQNQNNKSSTSIVPDGRQPLIINHNARVAKSGQ